MAVMCGITAAMGVRASAQSVADNATTAALTPADAAIPAANAKPAVNPADAPLPSLKEIVAKNDAVMGGQELWNKATTRKLKGLYQSEDNSTFFSIEILQKSPNKSMYKITLPNQMVLRNVCDGRSAWVEDPMGGYHELTGAALAGRLRGSQFLDRGLMVLLASTGKVLGVEKVGKHTAYVVQFTPQKDEVSKVYFDVDSGYLVHSEVSGTTDSGPFTMKLDFDDYREVDGLKFPYRMKLTETGAVMNIRITQVSVNAPMEDALFLKPESAPK
jgi:hypothetical protein